MLVSSIQSLAKRLRRGGDFVPPTGVAGRPLRIAIVTEYYYPHLGGVCEHVHFFAREARRRGHHVDIITSRIPGAAPSPHVIRMGRSQPVYANGSSARVTLGIGLRRKMRDALRRGGYDVVHVHSPLVPTLPWLAIEEADCPVVGTFHTDLPQRSALYTILHGYCQKRLTRLDAAIAVSPTAARALNRHFDVDWHIIPNGVDTALFHPHAPAPAGFETDVPTVLFLGRFDPRNGLGTLIDAFMHVRGRQREARLVVVGDGPERDRHYRTAGGRPDVTFVGPVLHGRAGYYAHSDVYACPTTTGTFGVTILESMACATAVVCSDIPGFQDWIVDGREALMFRRGSFRSLADALVRVLDDDALRTRLGRVGRDRALLYSWPRVTDQVLGVYARLLGRGVIAA
jgi:phosphatidyl-myo-inositol alpha-mannosyltransferase